MHVFEDCNHCGVLQRIKPSVKLITVSPKDMKLSMT